MPTLHAFIFTIGAFGGLLWLASEPFPASRRAFYRLASCGAVTLAYWYFSAVA